MTKTSYLFISLGLLLALTVSGCTKEGNIQNVQTEPADLMETPQESEDNNLEQSSVDIDQRRLPDEPSSNDIPEPVNAINNRFQNENVKEVQLQTYKDGVYSGTGNYNTPGGQENVSLTITLSGDKIISAVPSGRITNEISKQFHNQYMVGFNDTVVGKNIADLKFGFRNGASLTPSGFNTALAQIKAAAKQ